MSDLLCDEQASLMAVGDVFLADHYFTIGHGLGSRLRADHDPFREISAALCAADICIGNLEAPLGTSVVGTSKYERLAFIGPPLAASVLKSSGFDALSVANNHIMQHGESAFRSTQSALHDAGVEIVGLLEHGRQRPVIVEKKGVTFGLLAYSFVQEVRYPDQRLYAHGSNTVYLEEIRELSQLVDNVVVSVHWGEENTEEPTLEVVTLAREMSKAGARAILGHHPHWLQKVEMVDATLVAYSLGDLVFGLFWDDRSVWSAVLELTFSRTAITSYRLHPVRFCRDYVVRWSQEDLSEFDRSSCQTISDSGSSKAGSGAIAHYLTVVRKAVYFLVNFHRGNTCAKLSFILAKIGHYARQN